MPIIFSPRRWQRQPTIPVVMDFGHPLARGYYNPAAFFYIFSPACFPSGFSPVQLDVIFDTTRKNNAFLSTTPPFLVANAYGTGVGTSPTNSRAVNSSVLIDARINPQGTIYWAQQPNTAFNTGAIRGMWGATTGISQPAFDAQCYLDNKLYIGWNKSGTDARVVVSASAALWSVGHMEHWAFTWINGGKSELFFNGISVGVATVNSAVTAFTGSDTFRIGTQGGISQVFDGQFAYFGITGALHDVGMIREMARNPYQIMSPRMRRLYILQPDTSPPSTGLIGIGGSGSSGGGISAPAVGSAG